MKVTSIRAKNFLGFGEEGIRVEGLGDSTIIVGPNGSGKSSLFRALEFVAQQLERIQGPGSGAVEPEWIHRMDTGRKLLVEVGIRLNKPELKAAVQSGVLGLMYEPRSDTFDREGNINPQAASTAISLVHSKCRGLFESWLGEELFFTVEVNPGRMSSPDVYVRTAIPESGLVVTQDGVAKNPFRHPTSIFRLEREVWKELALRFPGKFDLRQPDFVFSEESAQEIASRFTSDWIWANLDSNEGVPMKLYLERCDGRSRDPMTRGLVLDLSVFLGITDRDVFSVSLFGTLSQIFSSSIVLLSDTRLKSLHPFDPRAEVHAPIQLVRGFDLSDDLYGLKNSKQLEGRRRYEAFKSEFQQMSGYNIDVVLDQRFVSPPDTSKEGAYEPFTRVMFSQGNLTFSTEFAAAGLAELALVLFAALGHQDSVVLLDEPALNLHPAMQKSLHTRLSSVVETSGIQLMIVTHSPEFVSPTDIRSAIRLSTEGEKCKVQRLKGSTRRMEGLEEKLLDADPSLGRVLFATGVLLVEGEGEQAALPAWLRKLNGGVDLSTFGITFHNVHGDANFERYSEVLDAWGVPFRMVGDGIAKERLLKLGERGTWYPENDLTELFEKYYPDEFRELNNEWHEGAKNPLVARLLAERTAPPPPVEELWKFIESFLDSLPASGSRLEE